MPSGLPMTMRVYRGLSALATPLSRAVMSRRLKQGKEDVERICERRGIPTLDRPGGSLVWIHGASVGEVLAAAELIERLRSMGIRILLTSGTVTAAAMVKRRFPDDVIHQYIPYDMPRFVQSFLDYWQPGLTLFIESDLWPNLILAGADRRIPMVLINARMSPRSYPRWMRFRGTIGSLLDCFDLCLAQSEVDADRFATLGASNVIVSGNLKLDVPPPQADPCKLEAFKAATQRRIIFVAASTHPGEEEIILDAYRRLVGHFPGLLAIIVPRHPKRGLAIARMLDAAGVNVALRSHDEMPTAATQVYVADTMGELGLFYRVASVAFMGGSLVAHGGQNPIEAIKLGAAIIHGPHVFNFAEIYDTLDQATGALSAVTDEAFIKMLGHLLASPVARQRAINAADQVVERLGGALDKTLGALEPYLLQIRLESEGAHA
jgi:3-deoxy-D-manno-octulosonic-acid transferase